MSGSAHAPQRSDLSWSRPTLLRSRARSRSVGGHAALTRGAHACGSDRIGEALRALDPQGRHGAVVNLQGDQPLLPDGALEAALALLDDPAVDIGTLACPARAEDADDPNAVKLVGASLAPGSGSRALLHPSARALWRWAAIEAHRRLRLSPRRAGTIRLAAALPARTARSASSSCARSRPACASTPRCWTKPPHRWIRNAI